MGELKFKITVEEKPEVDPETAYKNAREKALDYNKKGYTMKDAIIKAADEVGVNFRALSSAVRNWDEFTKQKHLTREEEDSRSIKLGDAYEDEGGSVRYY